VRHDHGDVTVREDATPPTRADAEIPAEQAMRALALAGWRPTHAAGSESQWRSPEGKTMSKSSALAIGRMMCRDDASPTPEPRRGAYLGRAARRIAGLPELTAADREAVLAMVRASDEPSMAEVAAACRVSQTVAWRWAIDAGIDLAARSARRAAARRVAARKAARGAA
jgi:hypothetical protein